MTKSYDTQEWHGINALLLTEYLENKERLSEQKTKLRQLSHFLPANSEWIQQLEQEIQELEDKIITFISPLDREQLQSILYMSLDMNIK